MNINFLSLVMLLVFGLSAHAAESKINHFNDIQCLNADATSVELMKTCAINQGFLYPKDWIPSISPNFLKSEFETSSEYSARVGIEELSWKSRRLFFVFRQLPGKLAFEYLADEGRMRMHAWLAKPESMNTFHLGNFSESSDDYVDECGRIHWTKYFYIKASETFTLNESAHSSFESKDLTFSLDRRTAKEIKNDLIVILEAQPYLGPESKISDLPVSSTTSERYHSSKAVIPPVLPCTAGELNYINANPVALYVVNEKSNILIAKFPFFPLKYDAEIPLSEPSDQSP